MFSDTLVIGHSFKKSELRSNAFYDSMLMHKSWFVRTLAGLLIGARSSADDAEAMPQMEVSRDYFNKFSGKLITSIRIAQADIFGRSPDDDLSWIERCVDNLHIRTKERVIAQSLLFNVGDTISPYRMSINEQLLRNKPYLSTAYIVVLPDLNNPNGVSVNVFTRDNWTISANARLGDAPYLDVFDRNFIGSGNTLLLRYYAPGGEQRHGFEAQYIIDNIWGTFINTTLQAGVGASNNSLGMSFERPFIMPSDHFGGGEAGYTENREGMTATDTVFSVKTEKYAFYYGYSLNLDPLRGTNIYFTVGADYTHFSKRPDVEKYLNPYYYNRFRILYSLGISRQNYFQGNMIYGFGRTEDVAYGFKFELIGAYESNEFLGKRFYVGGLGRWGQLTKSGFWNFTASGGTFFTDRGRPQQSSFGAQVNYFSPLWELGSLYVRQFVNVSGTWGFNRLEGERERIGYQSFAPIHGLRGSITSNGLTRAVVNSETVFFTPLFLYHFRFAFFTWCDVGWLGNNHNIFRNQFAAAAGIGVRIKNERLIFNNVQIRIGFALQRAPSMGYNWFEITNEQGLNIEPFIPQRPTISPYQ
ncbi:MAG: hypothetical protein RR066_03995 [Mucinivorans sp.]